MKKFRIDYRWQEINNATLKKWDFNFAFIKAVTENEAISLFSERFSESIEFQIISINDVLTNAEKQRRFRKKKASQKQKEMRGIMVTASEENELKPKIRRILEEMRALSRQEN